MEQGKEWKILKREKKGETDSSLLLKNEEMMMNFMTCHNMSCTELLARPLANCLKLYLLCNILQTVEKDRTLTWRLTLSMSIEKHCKRSHMGISYTTTTSYQVNSFLFNIDATQARNCKIPPPPPPPQNRAWMAHSFSCCSSNSRYARLEHMVLHHASNASERFGQFCVGQLLRYGTCSRGGRVLRTPFRALSTFFLVAS